MTVLTPSLHRVWAKEEPAKCSGDKRNADSGAPSGVTCGKHLPPSRKGDKRASMITTSVAESIVIAIIIITTIIIIIIIITIIAIIVIIISSSSRVMGT